MEQAIAIKGLTKVGILQSFEKSFKELTGLGIIYIDIKNNPLLPTAQYPPLFNALVRLKEEEKFLKPIEQACLAVKDSKEQKVFDCCSLFEVAVPIIANSDIIGIALTTPARDKSSPEIPDTLSGKEKNSGLVKIWQQLPAIEKEALENWSRMLFYLLNYIFKQEYDFMVLSETEKHATRTEEVLHKAIAFINENYHRRDISLELVATEVYLSHYYFSHLFKRELKTTFIDYLTKVRLEAAKKLLKSLNLNVNQIAYAIGYQDPNYFSKVFKRNLGISPLEYRQRIVETQNKDKKI